MRYMGKNKTSGGVPKMYDKSTNVGGIHKQTGLFLAKVMDIVDDRYEGFLYVEILGHEYLGDYSTSAEDRKRYVRVRRASPYGGHYQSSGHTRSYGMSSHPPAPGTEVLIAFVHNSDVGILIGVLPDTTRNSSIPSNPAGFVEGEDDVPAHCFDPSPLKDPGKNERPENPEQRYVNEQGIPLDTIRGLSSSSQRRESPTNVFGFNTPGGHQFIMDDGTRANTDECLTPDKNRKQGLSNLTRMRSGKGAQLLMHDGAEIVYLSNHRGSCWIQLNGNGNLDIYTDNDISMHTKTNFNLHVEGDFNLDADTINMKARGDGGTTIENLKGEFNLHANKDIKLTTDLNGHIKCKGNMRTTAKMIDMNGPEATESTKIEDNNITTNRDIKQSIADRVPEHEPWGGHTEEQEILPCVASPNIDLLAIDIDISQIRNTSTQPPRTVSESDGFSTTLEGDEAIANYFEPKTIKNPRAFTQDDIDRVESLRGFNESIGGGAAQVELTDGERAYAVSKGYTGSSAKQTFRRGGPR